MPKACCTRSFSGGGRHDGDHAAQRVRNHHLLTTLFFPQPCTIHPPPPLRCRKLQTVPSSPITNRIKKKMKLNGGERRRRGESQVWKLSGGPLKFSLCLIVQIGTKHHAILLWKCVECVCSIKSNASYYTGVLCTKRKTLKTSRNVE